MVDPFEWMRESRKDLVTPAMREAGAEILGDVDLAFSHEEKAAAVYMAMLRAKPSEPTLFVNQFNLIVDPDENASRVCRIYPRTPAV